MSRLELSSMIRASSRIASRVVEGRAVVIVMDAQALHTLNEVGTFVWEEVESRPQRVEDLIDALQGAFAVDREQATKDVLSFVDELLTVGALEVGGA